MNSATPSPKLGWSGGILVAVTAILGIVVLVVSLANWQNEFADNAMIKLGEGRVIAINDRSPSGTPRRIDSFTCYPVFEYQDEFGNRHEIAGIMAFRGYFKLGEKVQMGKTNSRVVVLDNWFRSQTYAYFSALGVLLVGITIGALYKHKILP